MTLEPRRAAYSPVLLEPAMGSRVGSGAAAVAGSGAAGKANGVGSAATFYQPDGVSLSADSSFALVADKQYNLVRKVLVSGANTFAVSGVARAKVACDASAAPANGAKGDCTASLASGATCSYTCTSGYIPSGKTVCDSGILKSAKCVPVNTKVDCVGVWKSVGQCDCQTGKQQQRILITA